MTTKLLYTFKDAVATITLNRPEALNAIDSELSKALFEALIRVNTDDNVRAVVLTGAGERAFCTGSDLKNTPPPAENFATGKYGAFDPHRYDQTLPQRAVAMMMAFEGVGKPIICAINGYALGGGLEFALACDIRIASETARLGLTEVRVGSMPGFGGTQRLPRTVGWSDAMLLLLTADHIDAAEALRMGLVSKVVKPDQLLVEAQAIAARIAANAPLAVRAVKKAVKVGLDLPLAAALEYEQTVWGVLRDTEDRLEGRAAFAAKRIPQFKGR